MTKTLDSRLKLLVEHFECPGDMRGGVSSVYGHYRRQPGAIRKSTRTGTLARVARRWRPAWAGGGPSTFDEKKVRDKKKHAAYLYTETWNNAQLVARKVKQTPVSICASSARVNSMHTGTQQHATPCTVASNGTHNGRYNDMHNDMSRWQRWGGERCGRYVELRLWPFKGQIKGHQELSRQR